MKEVLQILAVLSAVSNSKYPVKLVVYTNGTGKVEQEIDSNFSGVLLNPLFSFDNEEELRSMLLQEIGEKVFQQKVKELGLEKE